VPTDPPLGAAEKWHEASTWHAVASFTALAALQRVRYGAAARRGRLRGS
jgi:hypothetical protein